jgi:hypothetical protein
MNGSDSKAPMVAMSWVCLWRDARGTRWTTHDVRPARRRLLPPSPSPAPSYLRQAGASPGLTCDTDTDTRHVTNLVLCHCCCYVCSLHLHSVDLPSLSPAGFGGYYLASGASLLHVIHVAIASRVPVSLDACAIAVVSRSIDQHGRPGGSRPPQEDTHHLGRRCHSHLACMWYQCRSTGHLASCRRSSKLVCLLGMGTAVRR